MSPTRRIHAHPRWQMMPVPGDALYLFGEREHRVVAQARARRFVEAWQASADDRLDTIVTRLIDDGMSPAETYYVFEQMKARGFLIERDTPPTPEEIFAAGLDDPWRQGANGEEAEKEASPVFPPVSCTTQGAPSTIDVHLVGALAKDAIADAGAIAGLRMRFIEDPSHPPSFAPGAATPLLVLTDDYLRAPLGGIDRVMRETGRDWLLARPVGTVLWLGPLFRPSDPEVGCWHCLAHRLVRNREVETHVARALGRPMPIAPVRGHTRDSLVCALSRIRAMLARSAGEHAHPRTIDLADGAETVHHLVRRPQCAACGDDGRETLAARPIALKPTPKRFTADGGHRVRDPQETWRRYRHHVSPITGAVSYLIRHDNAPARVDAASAGAAPRNDGAATPPQRPTNGSAEPIPLHNYVAGHNFAMSQPGLAGLKAGLRAKSAGKGMTDAQARASGLAEALERHSGVFTGEEPRRRARFVDFAAGEAVDPRHCMLFSERQYAEREAWRARGSSFQYVPDPFDEEAELDWSPVWSLTEERFRHLPTSQLYFSHPEGGRFCTADSNGCAAGNTLEEAILQGFLELVERDAAAVWWYNRLSRPAVDVDSFDLAYARRLAPFLARHGRDFHVIDLTHDFDIPVFAAITWRTDKSAEDIVFAFGAHFDARIALTRALTEMCQFLPAVLHMPADGGGEYGFPDPDSVRWWRTARMAEHRYLSPAADLSARRMEDFPDRRSDDIAEDVRLCRRLVEERGMEMLVLDQTRPDIGLPVARVIVPGMRHFWARFAPGRLYDVPVKAGWLERPRREEDLNPVAMFI